MNYDYTKEAQNQFKDEFNKISLIKNVEGLDGDIREAAKTITTILRDEEGKIKRTFYDYLSRYLFREYAISVEEFVEFVIRKQDERKEKFNGRADLLTKQRIEKCLTNRSFIPQKRDFVFKLAFILGMNDVECQELLKKGMNERGFNFKSPTELIYWYCLKFGYGFLKATELHNKFDEIETKLEDENIKDTDEIYNDFINRFAVVNISDENNRESVLTECLSEIKRNYCFNTDGNLQNNSLNKKFDEIIKEIRETIYEYNNSSASLLPGEIKHRSESNNTSLYDVAKYIYRSYFDESGNELYTADKKEAEFDLPEDIINNRLTRARLNDIVKDIEDGSRKKYPNRQDLITASFLLYELKEDEDIERTVVLDDFCERINTKLNVCGLLDINPNNLYEYFIMLCISTEDPLGTFQEVYIQSVKEG